MWSETVAAAALVGAALVCAGLYVFLGLTPENWDYNLARRWTILGGIGTVSVAVGVSAVTFQTITANRILTPSIMGLDTLYLFLQCAVVFLFGSGELVMMRDPASFLATIGLMVAASVLLFMALFRRTDHSLYFLVLAGLIFGQFFAGLANFVLVLIDPNEFAVIEGRMFASFNRVNTDLLLPAALIVLAAAAATVRDFRALDVLTLGRGTAISLGVPYRALVLRTLIWISVLTAAATVLVGPILFLGILVVSVARFLFPTWRHAVLVPGTVLVAVAFLCFGMLITERVLNFAAPLSVMINLVGGVFFIVLLLKAKRL